MVMIKGTWRAKAFGGTDFASVLKQGTGYNPIHAQRGDRVGNDPGRGMIPIHGFANEGYAGAVDPNLTEQIQPEDYGYCDEDISYTASSIWGYGTQTGTADRPSWGQNADMTAGHLGDGEFPDARPSWGPEPSAGLPGGTVLRSIKHGGGQFGNPDANDAKVVPEDDVAQGWVNKNQSYVEDATASDPSQYEMQTSMMQRDQVRAGSQAASGRANEFDAPIASRITGMKLRIWGASPDLPGHAQRHDDMTPKSQDLIVRPFWLRTAGTGYAEWMQPNELYVSEPLQRKPPQDAYQGPEVTQTADTASGGYTDEDVFF